MKISAPLSIFPRWIVLLIAVLVAQVAQAQPNRAIAVVKTGANDIVITRTAAAAAVQHIKPIDTYLTGSLARLDESTTNALPSDAVRRLLLSFPDQTLGRNDRVATDGFASIEFVGSTALLAEVQKRTIAQNLRSILLESELPTAEDLDTRLANADFGELVTTPRGSISIKRIPGRGWVFGDDTVQALPRLKAELTDKAVAETTEPVTLESPVRGLVGQVRRGVPEWLRRRLLDVEVWQWGALIGIITAGPVLGRWLRKLATFVVLRRRTRFERAEAAAQAYLRALSWFAAAVWVLYAADRLGLPPRIMALVTVGCRVLAISALIWAAWSSVDALANWLRDRHATEGAGEDALFAVIGRIGKFILIVVGISIAAHILGYNITGILAGLGIGGLAVALAAKPTIENLFGSITVLIDRPFRLGDRIKVGAVEGSVASVGLRSTLIRTPSEALITLPNSQFISSVIENHGSNPRRNWRAVVTLAADNPPELLEQYVREARAFVIGRGTTIDGSLVVGLSEIGPRWVQMVISLQFGVLTEAAEIQARQEIILGLIEKQRELGVKLSPA